jgi:acetate kinase
MPGAPIILCLNAGSSSLKFSVWGGESCLAEGEVEEIGRPDTFAWVTPAGGQPRRLPGAWADHREAIDGVFSLLGQHSLPRPAGVGHRLVHGGPDHAAPERVTRSLLAELRALVPLAPLHLPKGLDGVEAVAEHFQDLPQAVCFDTAFHRDLPELARRLPLPRTLTDETGIRRYGFHGLSYEYVLEHLGPDGRGRVVVAHLGNGASLAAVRDGRPIDTSMGLTPAGGFMMGTRTGDLDPGVLLYLIREKGYDADRLDRLVNRESGLLAVSGSTSDVKSLLARRDRDAQADLALTMFCYQVRKQVGAYAAALRGLDTLVFTGGIGERAAPLRAEICEGLGHLGVRLDPGRNAAHQSLASVPGASCQVRIVNTREDLMIARHSRAVLFADRAHPRSTTTAPPTR